MMATFEHVVITSTRYEWRVPAAEPWGAAGGEVGKAWGAAETAYRQLHKLPADRPLTDDAIWFHVTDDQVVIAFTHEAPKGGTA